MACIDAVGYGPAKPPGQDNELVGVDDVVPMVLWTRQFMEVQGYAIKNNVIYQDNQSSILRHSVLPCDR